MADDANEPVEDLCCRQMPGPKWTANLTRSVLQGGDVVGHTDKRVFKWAPEISNGSEDDVIVVPNIPLLGAINKMRADRRTQFEISAFKGMLG